MHIPIWASYKDPDVENGMVQQLGLFLCQL